MRCPAAYAYLFSGNFSQYNDDLPALSITALVGVHGTAR
jgi:hypothetical protein